MDSDKKFKVVLPAELVKGDDGEWKVMGLASTPSRDLQGEVIDPSGLDLTPIDMKKGIFNWDHKKGPENTIGVIDSYKKSKEGLWLSGRLFKNHSKAKAVHEIMSSLNKGDAGRMGMSVEGVIKERAGKDGKTIKKAVIHSCALTMNPVNTDTYASLIKSMSEIEFSEDSVTPTEPASLESSLDDSAQENTADQPMFSTNQVLSIVEKALSIGAGGALPPTERTGGDALVQSDMKAEDDKKKKKQATEENVVQITKSLKKLDYQLFKSNIITVLDRLQTLYPEYSRSEIWEAVRDRLETQFPQVRRW
jgi:hypothetical protein